jgi:hypothetical protein
VGKETSEFELADRIEEYYDKEPKELEEFIDLWTGMWLKKWNERVKLLIGNEESGRWNKVTKALNNAEPLWRNLVNRSEVQEIVVTTLIRNGEICGTSILAENLLKMELGENKKECTDEKEHVISVINDTLRKARELTRSKGPLIFVKIDKGYYERGSP